MIDIYIHPLSNNGFVAHEKSIVFVKKDDVLLSTLETQRDWKKINTLFNDVLDDTSFMAIFQYKDLNLWQFCHAYVVADCLYFFEMYTLFLSIKKTYRDEKFSFFIPKDRYFEITQDLCLSIFDHATINPIETNSCKKNLLRRMKNYFFKDVSFDAVKASVFHFLVKLKRINIKKSDSNFILFVSHAAYSVASKKFPFKESDRILDAYIKDAYKRGYSPIGIDCPYHLSMKNCFRMIKKMLLPHDMIDWYGFFSFSSPKQQNQKPPLFFLMPKHDTFQDNDEVSSFKTIVFRVIDRLHKNLKNDIILCLDAANDMIDAIQPKSIVCAYETGPFARALIIAGHKKNIQTIGVQHGMISDNHSDYMHKRVSTDTLSSDVVIPTQTFVWGSYWKDILCNKGFYPEKNVFVAGKEGINSKTTLLPQISKKYILVFYAGLISKNDLESVLSLFRSLSDFDIVVKLHPVQARYFHSSPTERVTFLKDHDDIYSLIKNAHICRSDISTVALEAISLNENGCFILNFNLLPGWEFLETLDYIYHDSMKSFENQVRGYFEGSSCKESYLNALKHIKEKKYFDEDNIKKATDLIITPLDKKAHS